MAVDCERGRYFLQPRPSIRHVQRIQFALSGPIPKGEKQFHFPIVFKRATEPEVPPYSCGPVKYSGNHPRILKIVVPVRRRNGASRPVRPRRQAMGQSLHPATWKWRILAAAYLSESLSRGPSHGFFHSLRQCGVSGSGRQFHVSFRQACVGRRQFRATAQERGGFPWRHYGPPWPVRPESA